MVINPPVASMFYRVTSRFVKAHALEHIEKINQYSDTYGVWIAPTRLIDFDGQQARYECITELLGNYLGYPADTMRNFIAAHLLGGEEIKWFRSKSGVMFMPRSVTQLDQASKAIYYARVENWIAAEFGLALPHSAYMEGGHASDTQAE